MATFNGHHCWNCWNVSLWIGNDEGLYRAAIECKGRPRTGIRGIGPVTNRVATRRFLDEVVSGRTPDGARYTFKAVYAALADL
jgi:hypothetical protein